MSTTEQKLASMHGVNVKEVKELAAKFTGVFKTHFPETKAKDEVGHQMLTAIAALHLCGQIVKEEATRLGFDIQIEVISLPDGGGQH